MSCVNSGNMRHPIYIQRNNATQDTVSGNYEPADWQNHLQIWCELMRSKANEDEFEGGISSQNTIKLRTRYDSDIYTSDRVLIPRNTTTLNGAIDDVVTTITIDDADFMEHENQEYIRIGSEFLKVTAGQGTTSLTVTRGAFGTSASAQSDNATVELFNIGEILSVYDPTNMREVLELEISENF